MYHLDQEVWVRDAGALRGFVLSSVIAALLVCVAGGARADDGAEGLQATDEAAEQERPGPLHVAGSDRVEVQLVLLDVVVLGRGGRTVPGLTLDDFRIVLDGRPVEPATLDVQCGDEAQPDVSNGVRLEPREPPPEGLAPRNIVLVFDYLHMDNAAQTLEQAREALERLQVGGERHMVVAIGESLRVELPFTDDLQRVSATLDRMEQDPSLYAGNHGRLTERRFYERLLALFDLMELEGGRKVMVLFSGPFLADGWNHDVYYKRLAAMAARTRTAVYPVDSRGLDGAIPAKLARIATETGGRITGRTNDLALAYARAQRDLDCTYTIGFYDDHPRPRKDRRIKVYVERRGAEAVFPSGYILRTREQQLDSMTYTAEMAPAMFDDGGIEAEVFVTAPRSARRWQASLVAEVPRSLHEAFGGLGRWHFGGKIRKRRGTKVHRFRGVSDTPPSTLGESFSLPPGAYAANLWLYNELMDRPLALHVLFQVPEMPVGGPFLVGPFLSPVEGDHPLVGGRVPEGEPFVFSLEVCRAADEPTVPLEVRRRIVGESGRTIAELEPRNVEPGDGAGPRCAAVEDRGVGGELPVGFYRMEVVVSTGDGIAGRAELPFEITGPLQ